MIQFNLRGFEEKGPDFVAAAVRVDVALTGVVRERLDVYVGAVRSHGNEMRSRGMCTLIVHLLLTVFWTWSAMAVSN